MANIKEEMVKLIDLQVLDTQRFNFKRFLEVKPQEIAQLEKSFEEKKAGLKILEEKLKSLQVKRKEKENELASKEENIKKLQNQLSSLKTNKEYHAMLTEIENHKSDCSLIEEDILKNFEEVDGVNNQVKKEKEYLAEQEKSLNEAKNKVNGEIADVKAQLSVIEEKRKNMIIGIDAELLKKYERILESRDGLAVVAVKNNACQGCFMNMPPQVINEIQLGINLVFCEMCNRILYLKED